MMAQTTIIGSVLINYWITPYNLYTYVIEIDYHNWVIGSNNVIDILTIYLSI